MADRDSIVQAVHDLLEQLATDDPEADPVAGAKSFDMLSEGIGGAIYDDLLEGASNNEVLLFNSGQWGFGQVTGQTIVSTSFRDATSNAITTPSATSGGGTTEGSINVAFSVGQVVFFQVEANAATADSTIEVFRDAARTAANRLFVASNVDISSTPLIAAAFPTMNESGDLESESLYYRITNDGGTNSDYKIQLVGQGI